MKQQVSAYTHIRTQNTSENCRKNHRCMPLALTSSFPLQMHWGQLNDWVGWVVVFLQSRFEEELFWFWSSVYWVRKSLRQSKANRLRLNVLIVEMLCRWQNLTEVVGVIDSTAYSFSLPHSYVADQLSETTRMEIRRRLLIQFNLCALFTIWVAISTRAVSAGIQGLRCQQQRRQQCNCIDRNLYVMHSPDGNR